MSIRYVAPPYQFSFLEFLEYKRNATYRTMRNISIGMIDNGMRVYITLSACQIYMDANISADERRRSITPFASDGIILYHRSSPIIAN